MRVFEGGAGHSCLSLTHVPGLASDANNLIVDQVVGTSDALRHCGLIFVWTDVAGRAFMAGKCTAKRPRTRGAVSDCGLQPSVLDVLTSRCDGALNLTLTVRVVHTSLVGAVDLVSVVNFSVRTGPLYRANCAVHIGFN